MRSKTKLLFGQQPFDDLGAIAKIAKVYTREYHLFYPHGRNFVGVFHNVGHSITATSATGLGNGAKLHL